MEFFPPAKGHVYHRMLICDFSSDTKRSFVYSTCIIGIIQLRHPFDFCVFDGWAFLVELGLSLELHPIHDALHNSTGGGLLLRTVNEEKLANWLEFWGKDYSASGLFLSTCLMNLSLRAHLDPKLFCCKVMFSLVWESKVGFSTRQLTNSHMWFFTWMGRELSILSYETCLQR